MIAGGIPPQAIVGTNPNNVSNVTYESIADRLHGARKHVHLQHGVTDRRRGQGASRAGLGIQNYQICSDVLHLMVAGYDCFGRRIAAARLARDVDHG